MLKVAAFFFNARGNEIVKSPTGLYRTLLHTLCQRSSALCKVVVDVYVMKQTCGSEWQWELCELKNSLATVVISLVFGGRNLLLFVDALHGCDLAAIHTVVQRFE